MAILIIEHNGGLEGANLTGRVLIGRRTSNHVVIPEPTVSRIHAWIDTANGHFHVTDTGSRTGTYVNEKVISGKRPLADGDQIRVGTARLTFRTSALPDGVIRREFGNKSPADLETQGILFDCGCGAPLWVTTQYAGKTGRCRHCGRVVRVPSARTRAAQEAGAVPAGAMAGSVTGGGNAAAAATAPRPPAATMCGVCQSAISVFEEVHDCPSCGLRFHAECWQENFGCSAYGCDQVNVLKPRGELDQLAEAAAVVKSAPTRRATPNGKPVVKGNATLPVRPKAPGAKAGPAAPRGRLPTVGGGGGGGASRGTMMTYRANDRAAANAATVDEVVIAEGGRDGGAFPWEYVYLGASAVAALLGALLWGLPSLLVSLWVLTYLNRHRGERKPGPVLAAAGISFVGTIAGVVCSCLYWLNWAAWHR